MAFIPGMRSLLAQILLTIGVAEGQQLKAPSDQKAVLLTICQLNEHATVPVMSGGPMPLCGRGRIFPMRTSLSHWKPKQTFMQWSWETDPCIDNCRSEPATPFRWICRAHRGHTRNSHAGSSTCALLFGCGAGRGVYCDRAGNIVRLCALHVLPYAFLMASAHMLMSLPTVCAFARALAESNLTLLPNPSPLVKLQTLNLVGNIRLLANGRLPTALWRMDRLQELCIAPIGPLNCSETLDEDRFGRNGYDLAVKGVPPDPNAPPPDSLCINADCPTQNAHQQLLPQMPRHRRNDGGGG